LLSPAGIVSTGSPVINPTRPAIRPATGPGEASAHLDREASSARS
jgi:hypothetical protein